MKLFKWISLAAAALFTTGCAIEVRPHHRHVRVEYDTWDYCPPSRGGVYIESHYSTYGYGDHHSHYGNRRGYGRRHCR